MLLFLKGINSLQIALCFLQKVTHPLFPMAVISSSLFCWGKNKISEDARSPQELLVSSICLQSPVRLGRAYGKVFPDQGEFMINCGIDRCPEYLVISTTFCCQNRCICRFKRPVPVVSAYLTGGVIYTICGCVPKFLNHKTKTHSDSKNQYQKPAGWGQVPGQGRSNKVEELSA